MSALGQKRTCAVQNAMSALLPKADMCGALAHVCFGPKGTSSYLFDHLIGIEEQGPPADPPRQFVMNSRRGPRALRTGYRVKAPVSRKYDNGVRSSATTYSRDAS